MCYKSRNDSSFSLFTSIFSSLLLWMQLFLGIRWSSFYKDTRRTWNNWSSTLAPHASYQCLSESHDSHVTFWFYFRICIGGHEVSTFICTYTHLYNTFHVYHFSLSPSLPPFSPLTFFLLRSDLFLVPKDVHMLVGENVDVYFLVETTLVRYRAI